MLTLKKYNFLFNIIVSYIFILFLSSCTLKIFNNHNCFTEENVNQLKKLIIPKGTYIPPNDKEYYIPYTQKDLNKKKYDIFPPDIK